MDRFQEAADAIGEMKRKSHKNQNGGWMLLLGACCFLAIGVLFIVKPMRLMSTGGVGRFGDHPVTFNYSPDAAVGFGVLFISISIFLLFLARSVFRDD